jgi:hypothetical protein
LALRKRKIREMSKSNRARFGPAAKWEGDLTEATTKKMDWSPVTGSGHYDTSYYVSPDGKSWLWSWKRQTYVRGDRRAFLYIRSQ